MAKNVGGLALTVAAGVPPLMQIQTALATIDTIVRDPSKRPSQDEINSAFDNAYSLLKPDTNNNVPEEINEFRKAFDELLDAAEITRLVVLIDDLDRCLPETAIETLEAIRLFVFTKRTAFVVAADEAMIEYAVRKHFPDLPSSTGPQTYARNYLEKLIQIPIRIPPLGVTETKIYVTLLLIGAELGEDIPEFNQLIVAARERLKRPWSGETIDATLIKETMGDKAPLANQALILSDQIGPILANGTRGNPRQIKRFLNALMLRKRTADARGFGDLIVIPILAKLMLAEQFTQLQRMFEQIALKAITSPDGTCEELNQLEAVATTNNGFRTEIGQRSVPHNGKTSRKGPIPIDGAGKDSGNPLLNEWLEDEQYLEWAAIRPSLAGVDLRPYLFVTKDRKNYFGTTTALGLIATIAELLLGPKISITAREDDIKKLSPTEANSVFEQIRSHIIGNGEFETEPAGIAGMTILAKAHPTLQGNLLDFLEALPPERLGVWVVTGWSEVIKDPNMMARFQKLLQQWSSLPKLKAATTAVQKILNSKGQ